MNLTDVLCIIAFTAGVAAGFWVGMYYEFHRIRRIQEQAQSRKEGQ